jgi:hypothetical protein
VYALVAVGLACALAVARDRHVVRALRTGVLAVAGFAVPWMANVALERAVGGNSRADRASGAASSGFGDLATRVREGVVTTVGVLPRIDGGALLLGGALVAAVLAAIVMARRGEVVRAQALLIVAGLVYLLRASEGLGFVPGLFASTPVAVAALALRRTGSVERYVLAVALGALPLVWAFQYTGGALPQWGGRYVLASAVLLVAVGVAVLQASPAWLSRTILGGTVVLGAFSVGWLVERSHDVAGAFDELVARPEDVVVVRNGFFVREGGRRYSDRRWLTAVDDESLREAADVVAAAGLSSFVVLDEDPAAPARLGPARHTRDDDLTILGVTFHLHQYQVQTT